MRETAAGVAGVGILALALAMAAQPAAAAILRVPTAAFPGIQSAVDAAAPGDVVQVLKGGGSGPNGEYRENVVIEKAIRLQCVSSAAIDVSETATTRAGRDFTDGITVLGPGGNGAKVEGCVVKFAKPCILGSAACPNNDTDGNGIKVSADAVAVKNCRSVGNILGLSVVGNAVTVAGTTVSGNVGGGIQVTGDSFRLLKNRVAGNLSGGISVAGNSGEIRSNTVSATLSSPLVVTGAGNSVRNNVVLGAIGPGLNANGTANAVANNAVRGGIQGIIVTGDGNLVSGNKSEDALVGAIQVTGAGCGTIARNVASNSMTGLQVSCSTSAPSIHANVATGSANFGFLFDVNAAAITGNKASACGFAGFTLNSGGNVTFSGNTAAENFGSGFLVMGAGDNVTFIRNKAIGNGWDGIDVNLPAATAIVFQANTVLRNEGTGIENDAQGSTIVGNRVLENRTDIAGKGGNGGGTVGVFTGNVFRTGGADTMTLGTGLF